MFTLCRFESYTRHRTRFDEKALRWLCVDLRKFPGYARREKYSSDVVIERQRREAKSGFTPC